MVKRLSIFLFVFSIGCFVLTCAQSCNGQTKTPKLDAKQESTSDPVKQNKLTPKQEGPKQDTTKQEIPKKEGLKQESEKKPPAKQDESEKALPKKDSSKKDVADSPKRDPVTEPAKVDESKKDSPKSETAPAKSETPPAKSDKAPVPMLPGKVDDKEAAAKPVKAMMRSEDLLPASTKLWVSIPDSKQLSAKFDETQIGLLAKDEAIKPFIESFRSQVKDWLNGQNVRLGMDVDDINGVQTGEICVAGVLPELDGKQPGKAAHGLVLLVDVSNTQDEARNLLKKVNAELVKRGAKQEQLKIHDVEYVKSTLKNPKRFRPNQSNFQTLVNGWLLVSDNETIFRDVLIRLATNKVNQAETLSAQPSFIAVMKRASLGDETAHVSWFVDPFGYLQLAQALEAEDRPNRVAHDDWAGKLRNNGFDAFQGVGGNVSVATSEHEVLHRTYIYAPRDEKLVGKKQVFDLFDFSRENTDPLTPAKWVPSDCSDYFVANWNMSRALDGFGVIYDGIMGEDAEGEFDRMLSDFRVDPDMQLDIRKLIGLMDDRITVVSAVERPITETSERICIGIPIKGEPKFIFDSIKRGSRGQVISLGGIEVIKVDSTERDLEEDDPHGIFEIEGAEIEEEEEEKREFELFQKRFFVVRDGFLLVANNKDFLRELMSQKESQLAQCPDYLQVKEALGKLADEEKISFRQFGRIDLALEANYEMLRRGEMGKSQTVLARVVNQIFAKQAAEKAAAEGGKVDPAEIRKQKLDGSKLPKDYAKSIAPYFGPNGWVMETEKNGWCLTGCVLKKKVMTEVVQKAENDKPAQR